MTKIIICCPFRDLNAFFLWSIRPLLRVGQLCHIDIKWSQQVFLSLLNFTLLPALGCCYKRQGWIIFQNLIDVVLAFKNSILTSLLLCSDISPWQFLLQSILNERKTTILRQPISFNIPSSLQVAALLQELDVITHAALFVRSLLHLSPFRAVRQEVPTVLQCVTLPLALSDSSWCLLVALTQARYYLHNALKFRPACFRCDLFNCKHIELILK